MGRLDFVVGLLKVFKLHCFASRSFDFSLPSSPSPCFATSTLKGFGSAPYLKALVCDTWIMDFRQQRKNMLDFEYVAQLVERKDGGHACIQIVDCFISGMRYQAWLRKPKNGSTKYRSTTMFEDATHEILRDLFWDDEVRPTWNTMLSNSTTIGTKIVKWISKVSL